MEIKLQKDLRNKYLYALNTSTIDTCTTDQDQTPTGELAVTSGFRIYPALKKKMCAKKIAHARSNHHEVLKPEEN